MRKVVVALIVALLAYPVLAGPEPARDRASQASLRLYRNLPKDPLVVLGVFLDDPSAELNSLVQFVGRLAAGDAEEQPGTPLDVLGSRLASTLPEELLRSIGPEITLGIDLPPIDEAVMSFQQPGVDPLAFLLRDVGLLAQAKDGQKLDRALRSFFARLGADTSEADDGLIEIAVPLGAPPTRPLTLYYAVGEGRLAAGFARDWVLAAFEGRPKGERLTDGQDFAAVFSQLDSRPTDLTYVNLPRLRNYIVESSVLRIVLEANPEARDVLERLVTSDTMSVGLGSTSVALRHGVRTTHFGPPWMSGAAASGGLIAALALPTMLTAVDRGRARRTLTDIEAIAAACEGFSTDSKSYPGPTEGWVPVEKIAAFLEPVYIARLPRTDAWQNPILYWSDGGSYRIISTGRDGRMDQDWSAVIEPVEAATELAGDIVYGDGQLLVLPRGPRPN